MAAHQRVPDDGPSTPAHQPCECPRAECGVRFTGYLRVAINHGLACDRPLLLVMSCGHRWVTRCRVSDVTKCRPCGEQNRRLVARKAEIGLTARPTWRTFLVTVTAPSTTEHLQWDPGFLRGSRPVCGCSAAPEVDDWNPSAGECWNRLRTALRRDHPAMEFHRFAEVQVERNRGALHHHVLVVTPDPLDVLRVQELAMAAGYGCVIDVRAIPMGDEARAARYVSKYVTKGADRWRCKWRADVVDRATGEVTRAAAEPTFRAHSSSAGWGITLREIREAIRAAARRRAERLREVEIPQLHDGSEAHDPAGVLAPD